MYNFICCYNGKHFKVVVFFVFFFKLNFKTCNKSGNKNPQKPTDITDYILRAGWDYIEQDKNH